MLADQMQIKNRSYLLIRKSESYYIYLELNTMLEKLNTNVLRGFQNRPEHFLVNFMFLFYTYLGL